MFQHSLFLNCLNPSQVTVITAGLRIAAQSKQLTELSAFSRHATYKCQVSIGALLVNALVSLTKSQVGKVTREDPHILVA
jgi:hypothetical protein